MGMGKENGVRWFAWERYADNQRQLSRYGVIKRRTGVDEDTVVLGGDFDAGAADLVGTAMMDDKREATVHACYT